MSKFRTIHYLLCFVLVFGMLGVLAVDRVALAANESSNGSFLSLPNQEGEEEKGPEPELRLSSQYPVLRAKSGEAFKFLVELTYLHGKEDRTFSLKVTGVDEKHWATTIKPEYKDTKVSAIQMAALKTYPEKLEVIVVPLPWALPEPGEYVFGFEATSGDIQETVELKAVVTARYELDLYTETGRLNTEAKAGEENHFTIKLINSGSTAIDDISFTSTKPEGWNITYNPKKVENLEAGLVQDVDVTIEPPSKTIAGDYLVTIRANSKEFNDKLELRVTVLTPTIWGWVGIIIVVVVVIGLAILFRQLGRR